MNDLFDVFRDEPLNLEACRRAVQALVELPPDQPVAEEAWAFLEAEEQDEVRTWAITVLYERPEPDTFERLLAFVRAMESAEQRRRYKFGRLFALKAIVRLADTPERDEALDDLLEALCNDPDEDALPRAYAAAIGTSRGKRLARDTLNETFDRVRHDPYWWPTWALLRALEECTEDDESGRLGELAGEQLLALARDRKGYLDLRHRALELLASLKTSPEVVRGVGELLVADPNEYIRLCAADTISALRAEAAWRDLVQAATDENAEVRVRAIDGLGRTLGPDRAIAALVDAALDDDVGEKHFKCYVDALRHIDPDPDRARSTALISKELVGDDRGRVQRAEKVLIDLGGWSAMKSLGRRQTLERLDTLLESSEQVVQSTFAGIIKQAQRNYAFALGVNVLLVLAGVVLLGIAIARLISEPDDWGDWLAPGAGGFVGIVLGRFFNDPRRNAREDLATLVNVNILFLGFLRQVNQIDATFKHAYIESRNFGGEDMERSVTGIERAVLRALEMVARHLRLEAGTASVEASWQPPEPPPNGDGGVAARERVTSAAG